MKNIVCLHFISLFFIFRFLYQIASALQHMHEKGYVHLDVKPSNCFVSQSGTIKLGDFGCTCKLNDIPAYVSINYLPIY